jgi:hypothetical protein
VSTVTGTVDTRPIVSIFVVDSVPRLDTHITVSKLGQKAFAGHNIARLLSSLQKRPVPLSAPNPNTHVSASTLGQKAFASHNIAHLLSSLQKVKVPPFEPNPGE